MNASTARWRATCLVVLAAFLGLAAAVHTTGLLPGDALVRQEVLKGRGTLVHAIAHWTNYGGTWVVLLPAMALVLAFSQTARQRWYLWSGVFVTAGAFELLFKVLVARPRPRGVHWGFPSGHVTAAATFGVLLIYLVSRERLTPPARRAFQGLAVTLVVAVGFARVILNTHWPADVLGGLLLGAGCAAAGAWWDASRPDLNQVRGVPGA